VGSSVHAGGAYSSSTTTTSNGRELVNLLWASILAWTLCIGTDGAAAVWGLHTARVFGDLRDGGASAVGRASVSAAETEPEEKGSEGEDGDAANDAAGDCTCIGGGL
jgi:hypothetical protein